MQLTLITPYRDRLTHLNNQLLWWETYAFKQSIEWIVVDLTKEPSDSLQHKLARHQVRYFHLPCEGAFHKTKALNLGLNHAQGRLIAAFDVDLIPLNQTLEQHCWLAENSPYLLVTGYRLMAQTESVAIANLAHAAEQATLGPEDQPTALRKYLLNGERFGVMPLFWRDRLLTLNGWDETYIGWGAEDQDLIERYLANGLTRQLSLCRCHDLTYLHLNHEPAEGWNSAILTDKNRAHYYQTHKLRKTHSSDSVFHH